MTASAEVRQVRVGDLEMAVVVQGAGPDLVLLHGGGVGADVLTGLQERLATGHRVIAPEQRGHGHTPDIGALGFDEMAADTAALLETMGVVSADFVGWSDGGIVALLLARRRPDLVRRVVAIGASLRMDLEPAALGPAALEWVRTVDPAEVPFPMAVETRRKLLAMWQAGPDLTFEDLAAIERPVLLVAADHDMITLEHTLAMFQAMAAGQLAIIPDATHEVPRLRPEVVAALIEPFLGA